MKNSFLFPEKLLGRCLILSGQLVISTKNPSHQDWPRGGTSWGSARVLARAGWAEPARLSSAHYFELAGQLGSAQLTILKLKFQLGSAQLANLAKNLKILKFLLNKKFSSLSSARNFDPFCQLGSAQLTKSQIAFSSAQLSSPISGKFWLSSARARKKSSSFHL